MTPLLASTENHDPWRNLAAEEALFDRIRSGDITSPALFLWRNASTVVIGRNQNAWRECRVRLLESEGGRLARRMTGGGAVYHDLGNLCFTFASPASMYDVARQTRVIAAAVSSFGLRAEVNGRNDVAVETASGAAKFSGNAYRMSGGASLQHGTILIGVDLDRLSRYLSPPKEKFEGKGVASVRSRVANLASLNPEITPETMSEALTAAFAAEYGAPESIGDPTKWIETDKYYEKYSSYDFRFGKTPEFGTERSARLSFGLVTVALTVANGVVANAAVWSDALDADMIARSAPRLTGARYDPCELSARVRDVSPELADWILGWK